ncbi:histidine kinase [Ferrimonas senticii]|uniref:histidine kinase n=1 Tax=Ferrimonas senticii TaxID=394566 RepID=UPI000426DA29|nr:histidine kinase [Ferrimonas senticii]
MPRKLSLGRSVALTMIAVIVCVSIQSSVGLLTAIYSIDDGRAINIAGSLRMRSYQLLFLANSGSEVLPQQIDSFELVLQDLESNLSRQSLRPDELEQGFVQVERRWATMKQLLLKEQVHSYVAALRSFVADIDEFVQELEDFARLKVMVLVGTQVAAIVLLMALSTFALSYIRRHITQPLRRLEMSAEQMAAGDFSIEVPKSRFRELTTFGETMASASAQLDSLYRRLAKRVEAQDIALKQAHKDLTFLYDASFALHASPVQAGDIEESLEALRQHIGANGVRLTLGGNSGVRYQVGELAQLSQQVPLPHQDGTGRLAISHQQPIDSELLHSFALLMSQTLQSQLDAKQREQMHLMEERAVIARELHDSLGQLLAYMKIQLSLLKRANRSAERSAIDDATEALQESVDMAYQQLRELLSTFRLKLVAADLEQALESMITQLQPRTDAQLQLDYQLPRITLEANHQVHLLQLLQEAVVNAIKHAQAQHIVIEGRRQDGRWLLRVYDDGLGMQTEGDLEGHFGLGIMRERARKMGASLTIGQRSGGGVCVTVELNESEEFQDG